MMSVLTISIIIKMIMQERLSRLTPQSPNHPKGTTMTTRRRLITAAIASALPLCHGPMAHAQEFPSKPVTLYTAFAPGSGPDAVRDRINADVNAALSDPEIKARFETFAFESPAWSPAEI